MEAKGAEQAPHSQGFEKLTKSLLAVPKAEFDKAMKADKEHKQGRKVT
jgi:hypothetical protein